MNNKYHHQCIFIGLAAWLCTSCSYIQYYQQQIQYTQIQNKISISTLNKVNQYTSRTPFQKTYEFEFNNLNNKPYALIFYISESSFSNSIIKHRNDDDLHRDAVRVDDSKIILAALNKNLPKADSITWQQVANHIEEDVARDGYYVMQEYIRLKMRDL